MARLAQSDIKPLDLNLAAEHLGAEVLYSSDEWFASATNLIKPGRGVFDPEAFTLHGKLMDGWETGRHHELKRPGVADFCLLRLGAPGVINAVDIDTNHFTGNYSQFAQVEACSRPDNPEWFYLLDAETEWEVILPKSPLVAGTPGLGQSIFQIDSDKPWTHLRLTMYPDGGIARFKVYGEVAFDASALSPDKRLDLASLHVGAAPLACSDMFYSSPWNLLRPEPAVNMESGWESKRSRVRPHSDWCVIRLLPGVVDAVEVDTRHFRGNFPHEFQIFALNLKPEDEPKPEEWTEAQESLPWRPLIVKTLGKPHARMVFRKSDFTGEMSDLTTVTHVKLVVVPDGGVSRLRVIGFPAAKAEA